MFLTLHIYHFGHGGLNFIESTIFVIWSLELFWWRWRVVSGSSAGPVLDWAAPCCLAAAVLSDEDDIDKIWWMGWSAARWYARSPSTPSMLLGLSPSLRMATITTTQTPSGSKTIKGDPQLWCKKSCPCDNGWWSWFWWSSLLPTILAPGYQDTDYHPPEQSRGHHQTIWHSDMSLFNCFPDNWHKCSCEHFHPTSCPSLVAILVIHLVEFRWKHFAL